MTAHSVWRRYSTFSRRAVYFAQEEARSRGEAQVRPEHLILGLLMDEGNQATALLRQVRVEPESLRERLLTDLPAPAAQPPPPPLDMTLSEDGIRALHLVLQEANVEGNRTTIGTAFLLLGLAKMHPTLAEMGITNQQIREALRLGTLPEEPRVRPRLFETLRRWWRR